MPGRLYVLYAANLRLHLHGLHGGLYGLQRLYGRLFGMHSVYRMLSLHSYMRLHLYGLLRMHARMYGLLQRLYTLHKRLYSLFRDYTWVRCPSVDCCPASCS